MNGLPWYTWYPERFRSATLGWTLAERGAYHAMLDCQWRHGSVPSDPGRLSRVIGCSEEELTDILPTVMPKFRDAGNGNLVNDFMEQLIAHADSVAARNRERTKAATTASLASRAERNVQRNVKRNVQRNVKRNVQRREGHISDDISDSQSQTDNAPDSSESQCDVKRNVDRNGERDVQRNVQRNVPYIRHSTEAHSLQKENAPETRVNGQDESRKRNDYWDALVAVFKPELTNADGQVVEPKRVGKLARDLKKWETNADGIEAKLRERRDTAAARWDGIAPSPEAVLKHWGALGMRLPENGRTRTTRTGRANAGLSENLAAPELGADARTAAGMPDVPRDVLGIPIRGGVMP